MDIIVKDGMYVTTKALYYKNVVVPQGFVFDGVTIKAPFTFLFSNKDLRNGIRASCFHDYMCKNKHMYKRKYATKILCELWEHDGLNKFKVKIVYHCVNIYQLFKCWK